MIRVLAVGAVLALGACTAKPAPITPADFGGKAKVLGDAITPNDFAPPNPDNMILLPAKTPDTITVSACVPWKKSELIALGKILSPLPATSPAWKAEEERQALRAAAHCQPATN